MEEDHYLESCYHGGAFFDALGARFDRIDRAAEVINADVLDAWFPPSPRAIAQIQAALPWIVRTSPPTNCEGLVEAIAQYRCVPESSIVPGSGSSSLIFLALREWLDSGSRVLVLDPSYGEYSHVLENIIRCDVDRFRLSSEEQFDVNLLELERVVRKGYDLVVMVNPNNPTGRHIPLGALTEFLELAPRSTKFWFDEAYIDYVSSSESLEGYAAGSENVIVSKSMSKAYALSGLRVGYLCGPRTLMARLRLLTPPWAVGLPGQMAGVAALADREYYKGKYEETHLLREALTKELQDGLGFEMVPGAANFLFCHLPEHSLPTQTVVEKCREWDLFLRDPALTTPRLGARSLRIAVKDAETNRRMVGILGQVLSQTSDIKSET